MKDKNNSKLIKNCIISGVIIIAVVLSIFLIFTLKKKTISNSEQLTKSLKEMGVQFYEDFYYNQIGKNETERKVFLEKYKDIGIKVSLDNMLRSKKTETTDENNPFINKETNEECNKNTSMVIIYPKEPYGKTDYSIDVILDCGFESEK